jgi:hypothetical protein
MFMSRQQNTGQNDCTKAANKSLENVEKLNYLGTTLTDQN